MSSESSGDWVGGMEKVGVMSNLKMSDMKHKKTIILQKIYVDIKITWKKNVHYTSTHISGNVHLIFY